MNTFRILEWTKPYIEYDMIQKHTSLPELAEYRAKLLLVFLNKTSQDPAHHKAITIATSLVQLGLDTHDLVPATNVIKEEKDARSRQLKVLAGDYFSSRFYHILAQAGQIEMIKQLSEAICEVNRLKMNLYLRMKQLKMTPHEFLEQSAQIKTQLFLSFQPLMDGERLQIWSDILQLIALSEVLIEEITRSEHSDEFQNSWAFWHLLQSANKDEKKQLHTGNSDMLSQLNEKYNSSAMLNKLLETNIERLLARIQQVESESLRKEIGQIIEPLIQYQTA